MSEPPAVETVARIFQWIATNEEGLSGIAAIIVIVGVFFSPFGAGIRAFLRRRQPESASQTTAGRPRRERPAAPLSSLITPAGAAAAAAADTRPSIAVLPFENDTGDDSLDRVARGITEDVNAGLARLIHFVMIARSATRAYAGDVGDPRAVAEALGARYLIEGNVRRVGQRIRAAAQLVEGETGQQLWADSYDQPIASVLDEDGAEVIVENLVGELQHQLRNAEADRASRMHPSELDAWGLSMRAYAQVSMRGLDGGMAEAEKLARQAVERDPANGTAYMTLAMVLIGKIGSESSTDRDADIKAAEEAASQAVRLSPNDPMALAHYGHVKVMMGDNDAAVPLLERATRLDPNNGRAQGTLGRALRNVGRVDEAIASFERALRLSPNDPLAFLWSSWLGTSYLIVGRYEDAVAQTRVSVGRAPSFFWPWMIQASALGHLGRLDEARSALRELERYCPWEVTIEGLADHVRSSNPQQRTVDVILDGLRKAGVPEAKDDHSAATAESSAASNP